MHMSDSLLSAPVAATAGIAAISLIGIAGYFIKRSRRENIVPLMGVAGAFVFAAQMVNFAIPGTGSSGHIVGGILLASLLGPWAGFLALSSVLIIQCLVFADGGLMALGCNILNMGAMTCLVAYPLVFKPLLHNFPTSRWKVMGVSILTCVIGLELGAVMVAMETAMSGITALPLGKFLLLMMAIHLAIGVCEGIATGAVLCFVQSRQPHLLEHAENPGGPKVRVKKSLLWTFAIAAMITGGVIAFFASSNPDGLEWSVLSITGVTELPASTSQIAQTAADVQASTAFLPDYESNVSGIAGAVLVLILIWGVSWLLASRRKRRSMRAQAVEKDDDAEK